MNSLLEMGGKATVILRANSDFMVNETSYKKDDILFLFDQVDIKFTYNESIKDKTISSNNIMAYDERKLNAMTIEDTPITSDFIKLFAEKIQKDFIRPILEKDIVIENNVIFPLGDICDSTISVLEEGVFNIDYDKERRFGTIVSEKELNGKYDVVYNIQEDKSLYDINNNYTLPYFRIQIIGSGNLDKETGNIYIEIPKASLLTRPDYSLNNHVYAQNLSFKIINDNRHSSVKMGIY